MRNPLLMRIVSLLVLGALLCAPAIADSQAKKPVVVMATAGYDAWMNDLATIGEIADKPGIDTFVSFLVNGATKGKGLAGVDKKRPCGAVILSGGEKPPGYGFIPVTDADAFLDLLASLGHTSSDAGGGLLEIDTKKKGNQSFVRKTKAWVFFADKKESLSDLPDDPDKLVADLIKQHDWGVRLNVANVPRKDRERLVKAIRAKSRKKLEKAKGTEAEKTVQRMISRHVVQGIETAIQGLDQVTIRGVLDNQEKTASLELTVTALKGTKAAKALEQLQHSTTNLAGCQLPNATVTAGCAVQCSDVNTRDVAKLFQAIEKAAFEKIDQKIDKKPKADGVKKFAAGMLDVVEKTVATGRLDRRMSLVLKPDGVTLVAASHVADGPKLQKTLAMLVEHARKKHGKDIDKCFTPNAEKYQGVQLHVLSVPIPEKCKHRDEAIALVGENLDVVFGVADEAVGFVAGKDAMKTMKRAIDQSIASPNKSTRPMQFSVSLGEVAEFLAKVADEKDKSKIEAAVKIFKKCPGKDHIRAVATPIDRGVKLQIEIEEAVLQMITQAQAKKMVHWFRPKRGKKK